MCAVVASTCRSPTTSLLQSLLHCVAHVFPCDASCTDPSQVVPLAWLPVSEKLKTLGGTSVLRKGVAKAGPVVTDNGNFILDVDFGSIGDPAALNRDITGIVGVVETGLFCNMACAAYFGREDGGVEMWTPERA